MRHKVELMQANENTRFLLFTLGVFLLTLGAAVLLFALIEQFFFTLNFSKAFLLLSGAALLTGGGLFRYGRRQWR
mgnify:CR=1 FL=1